MSARTSASQWWIQDPSAVEVLEFPRPLTVLAQLFKALSSQGLPEEDLQQQAYGVPLGQILAAASLLSQIAEFARQPNVQHAIEVVFSLYLFVVSLREKEVGLQGYTSAWRM